MTTDSIHWGSELTPRRYKDMRSMRYLFTLADRPRLSNRPHRQFTVRIKTSAHSASLSYALQPTLMIVPGQLLHARWAMLGAIGCLVPEILDLNGVDVGEPIWWKVGAAKLSGDITINYAGIEGFRIAGVIFPEHPSVQPWHLLCMFSSIPAWLLSLIHI